MIRFESSLLRLMFPVLAKFLFSFLERVDGVVSARFFSYGRNHTAARTLPRPPQTTDKVDFYILFFFLLLNISLRDRVLVFPAHVVTMPMSGSFL